MFRILFPLLVVSALVLSACSAVRGQTPANVVVITATPNATPAFLFTPTSASEPSDTPSSADASATTEATVDPTLKQTDVKYVRAKQDINVRNGPGTTFAIVGGVFAGQTAKVTGYKSADEQWWRVVCPASGQDNCWVSADPALTEPADTPDAEPSETPTGQTN